MADEEIRLRQGQWIRNKQSGVDGLLKIYMTSEWTYFRMGVQDLEGKEHLAYVPTSNYTTFNLDVLNDSGLLDGYKATKKIVRLRRQPGVARN